MSWLIRKAAALVAAYSIALQGLIGAFAPAAPVGFDAFAVICATDASGEHQPSAPQHGSECDACLAACNHSPALVPANIAFLSIVFADAPKRAAARLYPPAAQSRHQPQASRAPPHSS
jgi:hypothetical protein